MLIIVHTNGLAMTSVGMDAAPGAFEEPGTEEILHQFRHIIAIALLPAAGQLFLV